MGATGTGPDYDTLPPKGTGGLQSKAELVTINGVIIKPLRVIADERGWVMEMLRADDAFYKQFGQCYLSVCYPGVVKGWHAHHVQTDHISVVCGAAKLVLCDDRVESLTKGVVQEVHLSDRAPKLVVVPPGIWHGMKAVGNAPAYMVNCPSEPYNHDDPDEYRRDPHGVLIPYNWAQVDK